MSLLALLHYLISHDVRSALPRNNDMGTVQSHIVNSLTVAGCLMLLIFMWERDSAFRFHAAFCASRSLSFSQTAIISDSFAADFIEERIDDFIFCVPSESFLIIFHCFLIARSDGMVLPMPSHNLVFFSDPTYTRMPPCPSCPTYMKNLRLT